MKKFIFVLTFVVFLFGQACLAPHTDTITPIIPKPPVKFTINN